MIRGLWRGPVIPPPRTTPLTKGDEEVPCEVLLEVMLQRPAIFYATRGSGGTAEYTSCFHFIVLPLHHIPAHTQGRQPVWTVARVQSGPSRHRQDERPVFYARHV